MAEVWLRKKSILPTTVPFLHLKIDYQVQMASYLKIFSGTGIARAFSQIIFQSFGNGNWKFIPNFCEREWETGIPRNGREREFPVSPAKDYGRLADWANKPRVDQTTICPPVLPQPTLLLVLCKCLNQPLLSTLLLDHLWCAKHLAKNMMELESLQVFGVALWLNWVSKFKDNTGRLSTMQCKERGGTEREMDCWE